MIRPNISVGLDGTYLWCNNKFKLKHDSQSHYPNAPQLHSHTTQTILENNLHVVLSYKVHVFRVCLLHGFVFEYMFLTCVYCSLLHPVIKACQGFPISSYKISDFESFTFVRLQNKPMFYDHWLSNGEGTLLPQ